MTPAINYQPTDITLTAAGTGTITIQDCVIQIGDLADQMSTQFAAFGNAAAYTANTLNTITVTGNGTTDAWTYAPPHAYNPGPRRHRPPRAFNPYVNASDLLEEFIRYAGDQGVRQREVLRLPVELFVKWLVIRACEQDQEDADVTLELPGPAPQPRCLGCQRWMRTGVVVPFHGQRCAGYYFERTAA